MIIHTSKYDDLYHINDHRLKMDSQQKQYCLHDLAKIIMKHSLSDKIGITLLHTHFDVKRDEIILRQYNNNLAEHISSVIKMDNIPANSYVSQVHFTEVQDGFIPTPVLLTQSPMGFQRNDSLENMNINFIEDITSILKKYEATHIFGLCTVEVYHDDSVSSDFIFLETNDSRKRTLITKLVNKMHSPTSYEETSWKATAEGYKLIAECITICEKSTLPSGHTQHIDKGHSEL